MAHTPAPRQEWALAEQFDDLSQQRDAVVLGVWIFLVTEVLFFGALFLAYALYRYRFPEAFQIAGARTVVAYGAANMVILLTSGFTIAMAAKEADARRRERAGQFMLATAALAVLFLAVKALEYWEDIREGLVPGAGFPLSPPETQIFFSLYWVMTAVHALHVAIGVGLIAVLYFLNRQGKLKIGDTAIVEGAALYWGLVDIIWIFLFPILYLGGRHG